MKHIRILYLYSQEEDSYSYLRKMVSLLYTVRFYKVEKEDERILQEKEWDLVILQDSIHNLWQKPAFRKLMKYPWLYISTRSDIEGYIAPFKNLFGVINMNGAYLSAYGIPEEMQVRLDRPVDKVADYYLYEERPDPLRIVYCPTGRDIEENDLKLLYVLLQKSPISLTIVGERYHCIKKALPSFVHIVSRRSLLTSFKKAHVVVASGYDAIQAMALCKPCVILGDYGLGGLVTPANYKNLHAISFKGRKGACLREMVPYNLLEIEIKKAIASDYQGAMQAIQQMVLASYQVADFAKAFSDEVERILNLYNCIKNKKKRLCLKPLLTSALKIEVLNDELYLRCGMNRFGKVEDAMAGLLKQCDGTRSIYDLVRLNGYDREDAAILGDNLYELWKEKLILFRT